MSSAERRRKPRINQSFVVRYYRTTMGRRASWFVSPLRDLSSGGARFMCECEFEVGTVLQMQLLLPTSEQPIALQARVAWAKRGPLNLTEHGVTFNPEDVKVQRVIDDAVALFLRKQQRAG